MLRRFMAACLSVLMVAALIGATGSPVDAGPGQVGPAPAGPPALAVRPIDLAGRAPISPSEVARQVAADAPRLCFFCVLSDWPGDGSDNVFLLDADHHLRVDGGIRVNGRAIDGATCTPTGLYLVCGKALTLLHTNGTPGETTQLSARTIGVAGGWQSLAGTQAKADDYADVAGSPCPWHPDPNGYAAQGFPTSKVCVGTPLIADPLNDPAHPESFVAPPDPNDSTVPVAGVNGCPADATVPTGTLAHPQKFVLTGLAPGAAFIKICPGLYFGGFSLFGDSHNVKVTMLPGGIPPCTSGSCLDVASALISAIPAGSVPVFAQVAYTLTLSANPEPVGGTITFYDGSDPLAGCSDLPLTIVDATHAKADCTTSYQQFGTRATTAVYSGDAMYRAVGTTMTKSITMPSGLGADNITICTGLTCGFSAPCTLVVPCSQVLLSAPRSGSFAGLLLFHGLALAGTLRIWPGVGAAECVGNWMTDGVPPDRHAVPEPCGPLGGLSGTIYAPHRGTGGSAFDANVNFRASGVANLQVIAARVAMGYGDSERFTPGEAAPDRLVVTPSSADIAAGASQAYTVEAFDADGNSLGDVTGSSTFGIVPDGSCTGASCGATVSGPHTVTATNDGMTATATLTVIPGPVDHLALLPANASIAAGGIQAYTADGRDAFDNSLGVVAGVAFTISPNGSCSYAKCTARLAGLHTVSGTKSGMTATTTLTVVPGPLDHLVLSPAMASVLAGVAQPYSAEGRDRFNNSLGNVTAGTVFTVAPNGSCTGASCRATVVGNHTVTGVNSGKSGKAILTIKAGPLDHLALAPASASIAFGGSQAYSATGRDFFNNPLGTQSGVVYSISPDGTCNLAVCTPAAVGVHTVTGRKGDATGTATLTVNKASPTLVYTGRTTSVHGAPLTLSATLKRPDGVANAGALVTFTLNGVTLTATTSSTGVASVPTSAPATAGTYLTSVVFDGDASFTGASTSKNLVVS